VKGKQKMGREIGELRVIEGMNMIKVYFMHVWKFMLKPLTIYSYLYTNFKKKEMVLCLEK
jgi:hypothetical protein